MSRSTAISQPVNRVRVLEFTHLSTAECLPTVCQWVRATKRGRKLCERAHKVTRVVAGLVKRPFVFCCWAGLKTLAVTDDKEVILCAFSRSPVGDERRLEEVGKAVGKSPPEMRQAFEELPIFGPAFVDAVERQLSDDGVRLSEETAAGLNKLGAAYGQFQLDVTLCNVLSMPSERKGRVYVQLVTGPGSGGEADAGGMRGVVVRVMVQRLVGYPIENEVPVLGFALEVSEAHDLESAVNTPVVVEVRKALIAAVFGGELGPGDEQSYSCAVRVSNKCVAQAEFLPSGNGDGPAEWIGEAKTLFGTAVFVGCEEAVPTLLEDLRKPGVEGWHSFRKQLRTFADERVYAVTFSNHRSIWSVILGDLDDVLENLFGEDGERMPSAVCGRIEKLLKFLGRHLIVHHAPQLPPEQGVRREALARYISDGKHDYMLLMKSSDIMGFILKGGDTRGAVSRWLRKDRKMTVAVILDGVEAGDFNDRERIGVCRAMIDWYRNAGLSAELDAATKELYELEASEARQGFLDFYSNLLGVSLGFCTLGYAPAVDIVEGVQRWARGKYVAKMLSGSGKR